METPGREVSWVQVFKCIAIGDAGVGKSCLLLQFTEQRFRSELDPTLGCDCSTRIVDIDGKPTKLQIWDTAGQELYSSINKSYYRGAEVAILVYDITRRETFDHVVRWLKAAMEVAPANLTTILIGNKCDLSDRRTVSYEEDESFAKTHGLFFMESSAKTCHNVEGHSLWLLEQYGRKSNMEFSIQLQSLVSILSPIYPEVVVAAAKAYRDKSNQIHACA